MSENKVINSIDVRVCEKYSLSFEEAAVYFGIGSRTLRDMAAEDPAANWLLHIGTHTRIKRRQFSDMLDRTNAL